QVALALVLLAGAGLMLRSFSRALAIDVGFNPESFLTMEVFPVDDSPAVASTFYPSLLEHIRAIPGVAAVGATTFAPLSQGSSYTGAHNPSHAKTEGTSVAFKEVPPGYFDALGVRLLQGRAFADSALTSESPATVLSQRAARALFGDVPAIGREIRLS